MTAPSSALDDRLRAIYGRLHVQAIKVAILLAALDWADGESAASTRRVNTDHWYRAQQIVETGAFLPIGCSPIWARAKRHGLRLDLRIAPRASGRTPASAKRIGRCERRAKRSSMRCVRWKR